MNNKGKRLLIDMFLYAIGDFGSKIISFLLVPFYTRYLSTGEYGSLDLVNTTQSLIIPIISLQLTSGIFRYLLDDKYDSKDVVSTGVNFTLISSFISAIVFMIIYKVFDLQIPYIGVIVVFFLFSMVNNMFRQILRGLDNIKVYSITGILSTLFFCLLNIWFIGGLGMSYEGMIYANVITLFLVTIIIIFWGKLFKYYDIKMFNKDLFKELLTYSIPLIPNTINWWIMNVSDRYLLNVYIGLSAVGIYSIANKFASFLFMFNSIFDRAWQTSAIENYHSENRDAFFTSVFNKLLKFQVLMVLGCIIALKPCMTFLVGPEYREAWKYANILFIANMFLSFGLFYGVAYNCAKKTKDAFTTTVYSAILNFLINFLLIKYIGIYAAAISTLLAYLALWISRIFTIKKYFKVKIDYKELVKGLALISIVNAINFMFSGVKLILVDVVLIIIIMFVYKKTIFIIFNTCKTYIKSAKNKVKQMKTN
ncbi:lipopolysaccharide biosynthesis protein [Hathewaya limosa]|uniref:O-antigen/teichoic acid export membrane protein n=1 Tax=Hathewaya limosa TaxID=1536 RepID=A0ABU0JU96_HATLI|nr:polysaccharide biosynthesis C-terminal domain-containing protein [Hathewaya limosa]MDQ0479634.1 O-antigen/teichoic acid export membrane protein [Hathewaya limosa]